MKNEFGVAGVVGLLSGAGIYLAASALSTRLPVLAQGVLAAIVVFAILLAFSLAEIPMMLFALRQMARSTTTSPRFVVATFAVFVMFASVYASIFVLLTGQVIGGLVLVALCGVRFAGGVIIK